MAQPITPLLGVSGLARSGAVSPQRQSFSEPDARRSRSHSFHGQLAGAGSKERLNLASLGVLDRSEPSSSLLLLLNHRLSSTSLKSATERLLVGPIAPGGGLFGGEEEARRLSSFFLEQQLSPRSSLGLSPRLDDVSSPKATSNYRTAGRSVPQPPRRTSAIVLGLQPVLPALHEDPVNVAAPERNLRAGTAMPGQFDASRRRCKTLPAMALHAPCASLVQVEEKNEPQFLQYSGQKEMHIRHVIVKDHVHPEKGLCLRCLQRGNMPRTTTVIRVGGGYLILSLDGDSVLVDGFSRSKAIGRRPGASARGVTPQLRKLAIKETLPDGTIVLEDGTRILTDGTRVLADGTRILADGTILDKDGKVIGKLDANLSLEEMLQRVHQIKDSRGALGSGAHASAGGRTGTGDTGKKSAAGQGRRSVPSIESESEENSSDDDSEAHGRRASVGRHGLGRDAGGLLGSGGLNGKDLAWYFDQEVVEVLPDGTRILKDGTRINPDGSMTLADGTVISADAARKLAAERKSKGKGAGAGGKAVTLVPVRRPGESEEAFQARMRAYLEANDGRGAPGSGLSSGFDRHDSSSDPLGMRGRSALVRTNSIGSRPTKSENLVFRRGHLNKNALDYLSRYCILDEASLARYKVVFEHVDRNSDGIISFVEMEFGLRTVNKSCITERDHLYIQKVLEISSDIELNFRLFSVIAALSERVVDLDHLTKGLINKMDLEALSTKLEKCKQLFYLLDEKEEGYVEMDTLMHELQAGRISPEHETIILNKFGEDGRTWVDFIMYLCYIPLFLEIHGTITDNPLENHRDK